MAMMAPNSSIADWQKFISDVYLYQNNRRFDAGEMFDQIQRFAMRGLKGVRKNSPELIKRNLIISASWLFSMMGRYSIDVEDEVWKRFPFVCSYCNSLPCACGESHSKERLRVQIVESRRPKTVFEFQKMFEEIYPLGKRTLEHAGIHFAEELGEFSEAFWVYLRSKDDADFDKLKLEAADLFSCIFGIFNSLRADLAGELAVMYSNNCHVCHKAPCECTYAFIRDFE